MAFYLKFLIIVEIKSAGQATAHSANYDRQWTEFEEMDNQANVEPVMASKMQSWRLHSHQKIFIFISCIEKKHCI